MYIYDLAGNVEYLIGVNTDLERTRQVNGELGIKFKVQKMPGYEAVFDMVANESIVELPTDNQQYRIKRTRRQGKGPGIYKNVEAHHVFFDIIDNRIPREQNKTGSFTLEELLEFVLGPTGWSWWIESGTFSSLQFENFGGANCLKLFNNLVERFRFEIYPDSVNKKVHIYKTLGSSTDAQIRYNHNLKTISEEINTNNLSTIGQAYGKITNDAEGNPISQVSAQYRSPNADIFGERWAEDFEDERYTSTETLAAEIAARLIDEPEFSLDIDYIELKKNGQNIHEFDLGDDIFILHEAWGLDLLARVLKIVDYPLSPGIKQPKLTISNLRRNIKDRIAEANRRSIEAQNAALAAASKATQAALQAAAADGDSSEQKARLDAITDANGNLSTATKKLFINNYMYADNVGLWAADPNNPDKYILMSAGGLEIYKGFMQLYRGNDYPVIVDGVLQNTFTIAGANPPQAAETILIEGGYWATEETSPALCEVYKFKHDCRYLKLVVSMYGNDAATGSRFTVFDNPDSLTPLAQAVSYNIDPAADIAANGTTLTIDLGEPTGQQRAIYAKLNRGEGTAAEGTILKAYARIFRIWKEG